MKQTESLDRHLGLRLKTTLTIGLSLFSIPFGSIGCGTAGVVPSKPAATTPSNNPTQIAVQAAHSSVAVNGSTTLSVTQQGNPISGGRWEVLGGTANGTIDAAGTYHAPAAVPNPATVFVCYVLSDQIYSTTVSITNSKLSISSISPNVIQTLTTTVQISGNGFDNKTFASVNGMASQTTFIDSQHISAVIKLKTPISASLQITVSSEASAGVSNAMTVVATFPVITVEPAMLVGGDVRLMITGSKFSVGDVVFLNGKALTTLVNSSTQISVSGYLPPWSSGNAVVEVAGGDGTSPLAATYVPIAPTAVSFDAASRFTTQAAFGPRPDLVEHIQKIGFDAYITEQLQQPPVTYLPSTGSSQFMIDFIGGATKGNSLLRQRVALGLQSIFVTNQQNFSPSFSNLETKLENDVSGNFRQLLDDITSDPSLTAFLNLPGNRASTSQFDQPNQNFARELMQLFTLGPLMLNDDGSPQIDGSGNVIPTYTQDTVIALTRALTGWSYPTPISTANTAWGIDFSQPLTPIESWHDHNAKVLFGSINLPAGQSTALDRQIALDAIFNHPNLPPFISRLLIQRLVKSNPSPAYVQRIATVFKDDGTRVRGNLGAVIRATLLDSEARKGDTVPSPDDGFLQQPLLFQLFAMNALQDVTGDNQKIYLAGYLGEAMGASPTVFYYFSPSYNVPGTSINSPEFMLFNNISAVQRSQALWGIVTGTMRGYTREYQPSSWLFTKFTNVPDMVEALNHLLYHGQMSQEQQAVIINYCAQLNPFDVRSQLESAIFLALNGDSNNISH